MNNTAISVILPIIQRNMSNIIAHQLVGVQPMSAPTGSIFTLKARYQTTSGMILLTRAHFKHFLRVYNRRKSHSFNSIRDLGYPVYQIMGYNQWCDAKFWCKKNLEEGAFIFGPYNELIFANHSDYLHFVLEVG